MIVFWMKIVFCLVNALIVCGNSASSDLLAVVTLFRHGNRGPIMMYKNDPYKDRVAEFWPNGLGQLTNAGKERHFELGKWFRKRYQNFIPQKYSPDFLQVRSSNIDRSLMSVSANLAGLFPPEGKEVWNQGLSWQPIPIHTVPVTEDNILALMKPCNKQKRLEQETEKSEPFQEFMNKNKKIYEYVSQNSGENITSAIPLMLIYDTLLVEKQANLQLPKWSKKVFPNRLLDIGLDDYEFKANVPEIERLRVGVFADYVTSFLENVVNKPEASQKFLMLSGHDMTILVLFSALDLFDRKMPDYAATVIMEMRQLNNQKFMNFFYKNNSGLFDLTIKDCTFNCPFDKFQQIIKPVRMTSDTWDKECADTKTNNSNKDY